ncbi:glycosyltransferase family 2 protein [Paenibacillus wynnii]|uniref:glycosyltransferase family 2 protein n=1 Tax=Paenibacillus wynnii TaxID=268407 RepID=UPI002792B324|nr:glycosyltransferase [Paenibacillus wynnii]MDQ0195335.1 glycosyltransferase involved in cell wall biosynthesis [Paenibacillus wynnii]
MAKISVLMPVYNVANYIEESICSILTQTYWDFELLIIDDGSTDGTLDIIRKFNDRRIKLIIHSINLGIIESLNQGIDLATGEYIARMDGDDIALPQRFERQVAFMDAHQHCGVCGSQVRYLGRNEITNKPLNHEEIKCWQLFHCTLVHPSVMIRRSVLINHGIRYLYYYYAEDYEIWNRLAEVTQIINLPEVLLVYRLHPQQVSNVHELVQEQHAEIIRKNQLRQLDIEPSIEDYQTHLDFCHFRIRVHEPDPYYKALAWAHKILEGNLKKHKYDHQTLNSVLSQCFSLSE